MYLLFLANLQQILFTTLFFPKMSNTWMPEHMIKCQMIFFDFFLSRLIDWISNYLQFFVMLWDPFTSYYNSDGPFTSLVNLSLYLQDFWYFKKKLELNRFWQVKRKKKHKYFWIQHSFLICQAFCLDCFIQERCFHK